MKLLPAMERMPQSKGGSRFLRGSRGHISRAFAACSRRLGFYPINILWSVALFLCCVGFVGCGAKKETPVERSPNGRAFLEQTVKEFHNPSAEATGVNRDRLLEEAARRYQQVLKEHPDEKDVCAEALLALGNVRALQGKTDEAVKVYATVSEKYPNRDWQVLQAWKAAADLLWETSRRDDARKYYARIVERFDKADAPMITKTIVRGSKSRLAK